MTRTDRSMLQRIWQLYICAIPFQRLWRLPYVGYQIQLPEIIFAPFFLLALRNGKRLCARSFWCALDGAALAWVAAKAFPCLHHGLRSAYVLDIAGACYLVGLYFVIRICADRRLLEQVPRVMVFSACLAGLLGAVGWGLAMFFDCTTALSWPAATPYPYFGRVARAQAWSASPNMLASILMTGIIFQYALLRNKKGTDVTSMAVLGLLLLCFVLTLSRSIMCLIAGLAVTGYLCHTKRQPDARTLKNRLCVAAVVCSCMLLYIAGSHVVIARSDSEQLAGYYARGQVFPEPMATFRLYDVAYGVYGTNYAHKTIASLRAIAATRGWGVGPGGYYACIVALQAQGKHPATFPRGDPHSTYFGVCAELGVFGFCVLLLIGGLAGNSVLRQVRCPSACAPLAAGLAGIFVALAIEALATDIMNFRHYWWLLAVTASVHCQTRRQRT